LKSLALFGPPFFVKNDLLQLIVLALHRTGRCRRHMAGHNLGLCVNPTIDHLHRRCEPALEPFEIVCSAHRTVQARSCLMIFNAIKFRPDREIRCGIYMLQFSNVPVWPRIFRTRVGYRISANSLWGRTVLICNLSFRWLVNLKHSRECPAIPAICNPPRDHENRHETSSRRELLTLLAASPLK
jgi:hypothetical protein